MKINRKVIFTHFFQWRKKNIFNSKMDFYPSSSGFETQMGGFFSRLLRPG